MHQKFKSVIKKAYWPYHKEMRHCSQVSFIELSGRVFWRKPYLSSSSPIHPLCGGGLISHRYLYIFFFFYDASGNHALHGTSYTFPTNRAIFTIIKTPLWTHPRLCGTSLFAFPFAALKDHKRQLHWQCWCVEWGGTLAAKMEAAAAGFRGTWGYLSYTVDPRQDNRLSTCLLQHISVKY